MKRFFFSLLAFGLIAFSLAGQSPPEVSNNNTFLSEVRVLESWIRQQMAYRNIPGLAVGLVVDRELVWAKGFGVADLEKKMPVTPRSLFRIASNTKTFTATAVMQLRDEGKLRLDDPVGKYLPGFNIGNPYPDAPPVTILNLLTHTSGLPREAGFPYWTDRKFPTMKEILDKLPQQEMIYPPGTRYKYSNLGMALLGEIVATVSGMPYEQYVTEHILRPLEMSRTGFGVPAAGKKDLVTPYSHLFPDGSRRIMPYTDAKGLTSAAGITSCVEDLARYVSLQFRDDPRAANHVLDGYTLAEMHRVHWLRPGWNSGTGLGFRVWKEGDYTVVGHGGWVAGNRSQISFIPQEKVGVVVLTNADDVSPSFFAGHILEVMVPVIHRIVTPPPKKTEVDPAWKKYVGIYSDPSWYDTEVMIYQDRLVLYNYSYPPDDDPDGGIVFLTPAGRDTFVMDGPHGNGEKVIFETDKNDRVIRVKVGENYIFPKK